MHSKYQNIVYDRRVQYGLRDCRSRRNRIVRGTYLTEVMIIIIITITNYSIAAVVLVVVSYGVGKLRGSTTTTTAHNARPRRAARVRAVQYRMSILRTSDDNVTESRRGGITLSARACRTRILYTRTVLRCVHTQHGRRRSVSVLFGTGP